VGELGGHRAQCREPLREGEPLLDLDPVGDVSEHHDTPQHHPSVVLDHARGVVDRNTATAPGDDLAAVRQHRRETALEPARDQAGTWLVVVVDEVNDVAELPACGVARLPARESLGGGVHELDDFAFVGGDDGIADRSKRGAEPALPRDQPRFEVVFAQGHLDAHP
jgi:hypothetical protein